MFNNRKIRGLFEWNNEKTVVLGLSVLIIAIFFIPFSPTAETGLRNIVAVIFVLITLFILIRYPAVGIIFIIFLTALHSFEVIPGTWFSGGKILSLLTCYLYLARIAVAPKKHIIESPLNIPLLLFIGIAITSSLWSPDPQFTLFGVVISFLSLVGFYFMIINMIDTLRLFKLSILAILFSTCLIFIIPFFSMDIFAIQTLFFMRARSTLLNPNSLGSWIIFSSCLAFSLLLHTDRMMSRLFYVIFLIVNGFYLLITFSRSSWIAVGIGMLYLLTRNKAMMKGKILFLGFFIVIFSALTLQFAERISQRVSEQAITRRGGAVVSDFVISMQMVRDNPIWGVGTGGYQKAALPYRERYGGYSPTISHNLFLRVLAENGITGFFCLLWIIYRIFIVCAQTNKTVVDPYIKAVVAGFTGSLLGYLFYSMLHAGFFFNLFWTVLGLLVAAGRIHGKEMDSGIKPVYTLS